MSTDIYPNGFIVLLGRRNDAVRTAGAMGYGLILIVDEPLKKKPAAHVAEVLEIPFASPEAKWKEVAAQLAQAFPLKAVVALTEKSVVPAAWLCQALHLPGNNPLTALRCTDKVQMKNTIRQAGIVCTNYISGEESPTRERLIRELGLPMVIKERRGMGSRGLRKIKGSEEMPDVLEDELMAETMICGTEMSVESFVKDGEILFTNFTEYYRLFLANILPFIPSDNLHHKLLEMNRKAIEALGVTSGITHMEVYLTEDGMLFGELAIRPPGGHIMRLLKEAWDFNPWEAVFKLHLQEDFEFPETHKQFAGVWIIHPGKGLVLSVTGLEDAEAVNGVVEVDCMVEEGDQVSAREGTGMESAHIIAVGPTREAVGEALEIARSRMRINMLAG